MRQYVTFALILFVQFSFAMANAGGFAFLLKQSEFQQIQKAEQIKYLSFVFQALGEAEQSKKLKTSCVVAGDVFPKTKNSCVKKHSCLKNEVPCAAYLGGQDCVSLTSKEAPTIQCLNLHPVDNNTALFFSSFETGDIYRRVAKGIADYCSVIPKPKSCDTLEKETLAYRNRFEPKIPKTSSLFNLIRLLFTEAQAAAPCSYDKQSQQFTGQDGQIIEFHFAIHAAPSTVQDYWDATSDPSVSLREPALKLIEANSKNNEDMRKHTLNMYKKLKNGELTWVGFEGSESLKAMRGGTVAFMEDLAYAEKELSASGLSPSDVQLAMIDIYGSSYAYYLWFKEQPDSRIAAENIKLIGVDNGRNPRVDELDEKVSKLRATTSAKFDQLIKIPYAPENHALMMKFYKMKPTPANLENLLRSPEAASASPEVRKLIFEYMQGTKESAQLRKEQTAAEAQEFKVRDYSMAQDTYKALVENGQGLATLGSAHEKGTIDYLIQACKSYRGKASSGSGSGKGSNSKSNSGSGVDSAN